MRLLQPPHGKHAVHVLICDVIRHSSIGILAFPRSNRMVFGDNREHDDRVAERPVRVSSDVLKWCIRCGGPLEVVQVRNLVQAVAECKISQ